MNNRSILIYIFPVLIFLSNGILAQETKVVKDFELWSGVEIEKSIKKDWNIHFKEEIRLQKDASQINTIFSQLGIDYRINKNFSLEGRYRYIKNQNKLGIYEDHSRYSLGIDYKGALRNFSIKYRLRYQKKVESLKLLDNNELFEKNVRNRITVEYKRFKNIKPFISAELFQLHQLYETPKFDFIRYQAGLSYDVGPIGKFKVSYGIERELEDALPFTNFILSINYNYNF